MLFISLFKNVTGLEATGIICVGAIQISLKKNLWINLNLTEKEPLPGFG